jgi:hypothetical protein
MRILSENREVKLKKVIRPKSISKYAKELTKCKKDCVLFITGETGEGKSVIACEIAKGFDRKFQYERNMIYSRKELKEKIETYPPSAFVIDEAINVLYKREWNKSAQKDLVKLLNICRSKKHLLIFVQPVFGDMDKDIRNERVRLWVYVLKRGIGIVFRPIRELSGTNDPFNLDANNKLVKKFVKKMDSFLGVLEGAYRSENFLAFVRWENMEESEYLLYESVKDEKKYAEDEQNLFTEKDVDKIARDKTIEMLSILKRKRMIKKGFYKYVASFFKISMSSVSSLMKKIEVTQNLNNKDFSDNKQKAVKI